MPRMNMRRSPRERRTINDRYIRLTAEDMDAVELITKHFIQTALITPSLSVIVSRLLRQEASKLQAQS